MDTIEFVIVIARIGLVQGCVINKTVFAIGELAPASSSHAAWDIMNPPQGLDIKEILS